MAQKNQSNRLTEQQKESQGVVGIFGEEAKLHDMEVGKISHFVIEHLKKEFPKLSFRYRTSIKKEEINEALKKVDSEFLSFNINNATSAVGIKSEPESDYIFIIMPIQV